MSPALQEDDLFVLVLKHEGYAAILLYVSMAIGNRLFIVLGYSGSCLGPISPLCWRLRFHDSMLKGGARPWPQKRGC